MPEILIPSVNFIITFVIFFLIVGLIYLVSKKCRLMPTILFYFFISSILMLVVAMEPGVTYLELYPSMGVAIDGALAIITLPFTYIYTIFAESIVVLSSLVLEDPTIVGVFLLNDMSMIYLIAFQGVLFLLSLLIFKKKNKKNLNQSQYRD